jgi:hypothetical protein
MMCVLKINRRAEPVDPDANERFIDEEADKKLWLKQREVLIGLEEGCVWTNLNCQRCSFEAEETAKKVCGDCNFWI